MQLFTLQCTNVLNNMEKDLKTRLQEYFFEASRLNVQYGMNNQAFDVKDPGAPFEKWSIDKNLDPEYLHKKNSRYIILKMPSYIWRKYPEIEKLIWSSDFKFIKNE